MNEERLEAYRNLIDQLLACSSVEKVSQILSANRDLVDARLELNQQHSMIGIGIVRLENVEATRYNMNCIK